MKNCTFSLKIFRISSLYNNNPNVHLHKKDLCYHLFRIHCFLIAECQQLIADSTMIYHLQYFLGIRPSDT